MPYTPITGGDGETGQTGEQIKDILNETHVELYDGIVTREFNRTWTDTLIFDKNEIYYTPYTMTGDITFNVSPTGLISESSARMTIAADGVHAVFFGTGFSFLNGIASGQILAAGTYRFYFLSVYGDVDVSVPGTTSQTSNAETLATPANVAAVADGGTAIDISWDNVTNNSGYTVEFSLNGTSGWTTLETVGTNVTDSTMGSLAPGDIRYFRVRAIGDGIDYLSSPFSAAVSGQTENSGDTTAPQFTFIPANAATGHPMNKVIQIVADEPMENTDGSEITNANVATRLTVKQTNSGGANIPFTAIINGPKTVITITPNSPGFGDTQVVYVAINNVEDIDGNEVTTPVSATITTSDRVSFGDIMDGLLTADNTYFEFETKIRNMVISGTRYFVTKWDVSSGQQCVEWFSQGADVYFGYQSVSGTRFVKWTNVLTTGDHTLIVEYDGSIDTNNGLDRCTLLIDGVDQVAAKSLAASVGTLIGYLRNATSFLAIGTQVNDSGSSTGSSFYAGEMKDFIMRSAGGTVEIQVDNLQAGTDVSGNGRNGTWA
jgi:hypothetical protein